MEELLTKAKLANLRATWFGPCRDVSVHTDYFINIHLCRFVCGDVEIKDYLEYLSDDVLMSNEYVSLTSKIYQFTNNLVTNGVMEWVEPTNDNSVYHPYKMGFDPKTWAPCLVSQIAKTASSGHMIDPKYAADLFEIYQLAIRTIMLQGYKIDELDALRGSGLRADTKVAKLYLYKYRYSRIDWPQPVSTDDLWMIDIQDTQRLYVEPFSTRERKKNPNRAEIFINDYCTQVFHKCRSTKIKPFERKGFLAEISPEIIRELIDRYITKRGPEFVYKMINDCRPIFRLVERAGYQMDDLMYALRHSSPRD